MSKTVEGTPVWKDVTIKNELLEDRYKNLIESRKQYCKTLSDAQKCIDEIDQMIEEINKSEVNNVLDYIRSYTRMDYISATKIDTLLCHCMNKLNGNIDSVFLKFDDPVDNKKE